jgi:hypothetical protein
MLLRTLKSIFKKDTNHAQDSIEAQVLILLKDNKSSLTPLTHESVIPAHAESGAHWNWTPAFAGVIAISQETPTKQLNVRGYYLGNPLNLRKHFPGLAVFLVEYAT